MSEEAVRRSVEDAHEPIEGDAEPCPVIALGQLAGVYYFIAVSGEIRDMRPRDMTELGLLSLFDGDPHWLIDHYPQLNSKDQPTGRIDAADAAAAMMRRAASAGIWNNSTPIRRVGVWGDGGDGIIAHCGDVLWFIEPGKKRLRKRAGIHLGDAVFVAAPALEPPAKVAASRDVAAALLDRVKMWKFPSAHLPRLVFGLLAVAMLGAAPDWRVHLLATGPRGCGKSGLMELFTAALGPQANYTDDPSEAGLRQWLSGEARAIVFDEAEGDRGGRVQAIIGMLRRMSQGEGQRSVRGSGGAGGAQQFSMAGSAALAAINAPQLEPQDRSRILEIELLVPDPENKGKIQIALEETKAASPALRARAIEGWGRFRDNLQVYRKALIDLNCDGRQADQLGALLAGAEMMLSDHAIDSDSAAEEVGELSGMIRTYLAEDEELKRCAAMPLHRNDDSGRTLARRIEIDAWPDRATRPRRNADG